jgi:RNA polymerase sigma-70 factor (ECF subfamily)
MPERMATELFTEASPRLLGLAYRILGSRADAEDAVQDTFLKWQKADRSKIDNPSAWLTTICTRRCIDLLRAAHRRRVDYVGSWLPEPIQTGSIEAAAGEAGESLPLAASLGTAFMLMLERLTPKERAAYLLHEIFERPYPEIARALDLQEATCRKLVSRARANIDQAKVRHVTPQDRQEQLLQAFEAAIAGNETTALASLLSDDIELSADSGGKVPALQQVLRGKAAVLDFIARALRQYWRPYRWVIADLNGGRGILLQHDGVTIGAVSFAYDDAGRATGIYIMRNPDKLAGLDRAEASGAIA